MKRILAAILAIILCLGLCACSGVKQEVYDAAMSSYEAAKAGYDELSSKYDELKSKVDKYSTVIEALEREDYDGAVEAVNAMRPAPEYKEIVITTSNYSEYFEVEPNLPDYKKDSFGNPVFLTIHGYVKLKDQYYEKLVPESDSDVRFNVYYRGKAIIVSADFSNNTYKTISTLDTIEETTEVRLRNQTINGKDMFAGQFGKMGGSSGTGSDIQYCCNQVSEFEIKGASGSLFLYE